jgi:TonB family protein
MGAQEKITVGQQQQPGYPYLFVDRLQISRPTGIANHAMPVLIAVGIDDNKRVGVVAATMILDTLVEAWDRLLQQIRAGDMRDTRLFVSTAPEACQARVSQLFPTARWQSPLQAFYQSVLQSVPPAHAGSIERSMRRIHAQPDRAAAERAAADAIGALTAIGLWETGIQFAASYQDTLTYYEFPAELRAALSDYNAFDALIDSFLQMVATTGQFRGCIIRRMNMLEADTPPVARPEPKSVNTSLPAEPLPREPEPTQRVPVVVTDTTPSRQPPPPVERNEPSPSTAPLDPVSIVAHAAACDELPIDLHIEEIELTDPADFSNGQITSSGLDFDHEQYPFGKPLPDDDSTESSYELSRIEAAMRSHRASQLLPQPASKQPGPAVKPKRIPATADSGQLAPAQPPSLFSTRLLTQPRTPIANKTAAPATVSLTMPTPVARQASRPAAVAPPASARADISSTTNRSTAAQSVFGKSDRKPIVRPIAQPLPALPPQAATRLTNTEAPAAAPRNAGLVHAVARTQEFTPHPLKRYLVSGAGAVAVNAVIFGIAVSLMNPFTQQATQVGESQFVQIIDYVPLNPTYRSLDAAPKSSPAAEDPRALAAAAVELPMPDLAAGELPLPALDLTPAPRYDPQQQTVADRHSEGSTRSNPPAASAATPSRQAASLVGIGVGSGAGAGSGTGNGSTGADSKAKRQPVETVVNPAASFRVPPEYPPDALSAGIEGVVTIEFEITGSGDVRAPRIVEAVPAGVFDEAALRAIAKWRYSAQADPSQPSRRARQSMLFSLRH